MSKIYEEEENYTSTLVSKGETYEDVWYDRYVQHMMEQMNTVKLLLVLQIQVFLIQPKNIMEKYIQMRMERMKQRIIKMEQHIM